MPVLTRISAPRFVRRPMVQGNAVPTSARVFVNAETSWRRLFPTVSYG
jgi:hypothetical protein